MGSSTTTVLALAGAAALLVGCDEGVGCADLFNYGIFLEIFDANGDPVEGATVEYSRDGESWRPCQQEIGGEPYNKAGCAGEESGSFIVRIAKDGFETETVLVDVPSDGCHPITRERRIDLEAAESPM